MSLAVRMLAGAIYRLVDESELHALEDGETLQTGRRPDLAAFAAAEATIEEVIFLLADTSPLVRH